MFDLVSDAAMLDPGRFAVVDQGSASVLVYDTTGILLGTFGGRGEGPGEFLSPAAISTLSGDTVVILDAGDMRASVFAPDLEYVREFPVETSIFGRFILDGATAPGHRSTLLGVLDRHPFPVSRPGVRIASLAADGRVWIRERVATDTDPSLWIVLDASGTPVRAVEIATGIRPLHMLGDAVLARWEGPFGVHYVRRYLLEPDGGAAPVPRWLTAPPASPSTSPMPGDIRSALTALVRNLATEQEIHYSDRMSYSPTLDPFGGIESMMRDEELAEKVTVEILHADGRGWSMAGTVAGSRGMCALTYGRGGPLVISSGMVVCTDRDAY